MKTTIYYFSGTGNTLAVARDLAKALGKEAELVSITKAKTSPARPGNIGICFPTYGWGLPRAVAAFVEKLAIKPGAYVFGVTTYGGSPGNALSQLAGLLKKKGAKLAVGYGVNMPGNYIPMYGAWSAAKQEKMFAKAKERVREIATAVKTGRTGYVQTMVFFGRPLVWLLYKGMVKGMPGADKHFVVEDSCTACGLCAKVCPAANVRMEGKGRAARPTCLHHCEQCLACLQWCPVEAIQYGKKSIGRARYTHPAVKAKELP